MNAVAVIDHAERAGLIMGPGAFRIHFTHDRDCPGIEGGTTACTCSPHAQLTRQNGEVWTWRGTGWSLQPRTLTPGPETHS